MFHRDALPVFSACCSLVGVAGRWTPLPSSSRLQLGLRSAPVPSSTCPLQHEPYLLQDLSRGFWDHLKQRRSLWKRWIRYVLRNTRLWAHAGLMLVHRLRRWPNIKPALAVWYVISVCWICLVVFFEYNNLRRFNNFKRSSWPYSFFIHFIGRLNHCYWEGKCVLYLMGTGGRKLYVVCITCNW